MQNFNIPANQTPEDAEARKKMAVMQALMKPPQGIGDGLSVLGSAIAQRQQQNPANQFPKAPGGMSPGMGTQFINLITRRQNGGLY
jgi:hypothetical protein